MIYIPMHPKVDLSQCPKWVCRSMEKKPRYGGYRGFDRMALGGSDRHSVFGFDRSSASASSGNTLISLTMARTDLPPSNTDRIAE
jgi:hypothetical protein